MANYAFTTGKDLPNVENGHEFTESNFCQKVPHTDIFAGKTGLKFVDCNLINCDVPLDAVIEGGIHVHIAFCANKHPDWVEQGLLDAEVANCPHVVDTDVITIDGQVVDTIFYYDDEVV